jgi:hypothetical protein
MSVTSLIDRFYARPLGLLLFSAFSLPVALADQGPVSPLDSVKLSGFATLGLTYNDNDTAGAIFSYSQKHPADKGISGYLDSVLGLQLEWRPLQATSVVIQGVARPGNDMQPDLRMGYVRQQFGSETALRVGRIRSPLYFDSDVSEIGYAYLIARPPMPLYGMVNSVAHIDGGDLQWRHAFGNTAIMAQGYFGQVDYKQRFYNMNPVAEADAKLRNIRGLAISATLPDFTVRASRTWIGSYTLRSDQVDQINAAAGQLAGGLQAMAMNPQLPAAMTGALAYKAQQIQGYTNPFDGEPVYTSIGFDANAGNWRLLGEATQLDSNSAMVGKYRGYQLTAGYQLNEFTPYVSVARLDRKSPALDTSALSPTGLDPMLDAGLGQLQGGLDQASQFANISTHSVSVGVRYDFRENMALKLQYDRLETPNSMTPGALSVAQLPFDNKVNLFTVTFDTVF